MGCRPPAEGPELGAGTMPGTWEVLHIIHRLQWAAQKGSGEGMHSVYRDEVRKCEEAKAEMNLEGGHTWWRDR